MVDLTNRPPNLSPSERRPVIALGTACVTAITLRGMGLNEKPMPFDWLETSPSMIRHCLETDFSVLLDRSYYRSLTGIRSPDEPFEGCEHMFYAQEFGLAHVFNHNDPTRDTDYRYLVACIERFRAVLESDQSKLFVQMRGKHDDSEKDFGETCRVLDELTKNAAFLQIVVSPPDQARTIAEFDVMSVKGKHTLYHMNPISKFGGQKFSRKIDTETVEALIANYGRQNPLLFSPLDYVSPELSPDVSASLDRIYAMAHIATRGDIEPDQIGWTGVCGSGLEIEGLCFHVNAEFPPDSFVYQIAYSPTEFSVEAKPGGYLGTRGLGKPIYGFRIFVAENILLVFALSLELSLVDGTRLGPIGGRRFYELISGSPLEAIRILAIRKDSSDADALNNGPKNVSFRSGMQAIERTTRL